MHIALVTAPETYTQVNEKLYTIRRYVKCTISHVTDETLQDYDIVILDDAFIGRRKLRRIALKCYPKSLVCIFTSNANGYNLHAIKKPFFDILYESKNELEKTNQIIDLIETVLYQKWHDKRKKRQDGLS